MMIGVTFINRLYNPREEYLLFYSILRLNVSSSSGLTTPAAKSQYFHPHRDHHHNEDKDEEREREREWREVKG